MKRPEVIRIVPRRSKKDRHARVEFVCPHCGESHIMESTKFDKITDGRYPCRNRKRKAFKAWVDKQVRSIPAEKIREIKSAVGEGKSFKSITKWFGLGHLAILHAIISPRTIQPSSPTPAVERIESKPVQQVSREAAATPAPTVINNYAPVTINYPPYPIPNSTAFSKLSLGERLAADKAWREFEKEKMN